MLAASLLLLNVAPPGLWLFSAIHQWLAPLAKLCRPCRGWLPGSEAAGITDVLFGDVKPTGKLSHTWPRSQAQIPINQGDANYDPLFPYAFGLTY